MNDENNINNNLNDEDDVENLIDETSKKLNLDINWLRGITPQEILYLLDRCPFLQMVNTEVSGEEHELQFHFADSGWTIHDYGDALSSSPGELLFGGGDFRIFLKGEGDDEGGEGGAVLNPGKGTIRKQAFDTAGQMVELAYDHGWAGIQIVDGHPIMERGAWIKAEELGMTVKGFTPTQQDLAMRNRIRSTPQELERILKTMRR